MSDQFIRIEAGRGVAAVIRDGIVHATKVGADEYERRHGY